MAGRIRIEAGRQRIRDDAMKIKPSDLRRQAQAMIRTGTMPSLDAVLQAVAEAREKYSELKLANQQIANLVKR